MFRHPTEVESLAREHINDLTTSRRRQATLKDATGLSRRPLTRRVRQRIGHGLIAVGVRLAGRDGLTPPNPARVRPARVGNTG